MEGEKCIELTDIDFKCAVLCYSLRLNRLKVCKVPPKDNMKIRIDRWRGSLKTWSRAGMGRLGRTKAGQQVANLTC